MANVYWHADGGNWSDHATHWFNATDGGGGGHGAPPGTDDNAIFDANSFDNGSQTVTIDATANCLDMTWTGATNTPTLAGTNQLLNIYGSLTLIAGMTVSYSYRMYFPATASGKTLTFAGHTLACRLYIGAASGGWTLQDTVNIGANSMYLLGGTLDTNGQTITCGAFYTSGSTALTLTLGDSTVNCTLWSAGASSQTLTANTSTIKVTGTGVFVGGSLATYNNVELNGTAHTISGDNTFAKLSFKPSGAQTITFTDTSTQTVARCERTGTGVITLTGTGAGGWAVVKSGPSPVSLENTVIDYCTATPVNMWFFPESTDGGNNLNIRYVIPYAGSGWWAIKGGR